MRVFKSKMSVTITTFWWPSQEDILKTTAASQEKILSLQPKNIGILWALGNDTLSYWCVQNRWHKELCDKWTLKKEGKRVGNSAGTFQPNVLCWAVPDGNKSSCLMVTHFTVLWCNVWQRTPPGWHPIQGVRHNCCHILFSACCSALLDDVGCSPADMLRKIQFCCSTFKLELFMATFIFMYSACILLISISTQVISSLLKLHTSLTVYK